jgi:aldehyde:ferredoxin oxidoreductase
MQPILTVDLSSGVIGEYIIPKEYEIDFLGGASLAARILYDSLTKTLEPLSPQAPLLFLNGPLTGTSGPTVGRFVVCGKSPATNLWAESNCGGFWGPELRKAGYDGAWITGKAKNPVYVSIQNSDIEIKNAKDLWGMNTYEVQSAIQDELKIKNLRVAGIGVAGERLIPSALILTDHGRVAGRTGMGAVMGSKNLKAIAVKGSLKVPIQNIEVYKKLRSQANKDLKTDNLSVIMKELGSSGGADYFDYLGEMPKKYFTSGVLEGVDKLSGAAVAESILTGVSACHACVVACGRVVTLPGESKKQKGPEYETSMGFGANLGITDISFVTRMGDLCDKYGMDVITVSNTIGFAINLFELGLISETQTFGQILKWGDQVMVEKLVHDIANLHEFGEILSKGAKTVGELFNQEDLAVQVNGLEIAFHDPRGSNGMALVYATSPRGACHNQSDYFLVDIGSAEEEIGVMPLGRHTIEGKAKNVVSHQNWRTIFNSMVMCVFGNVSPDMVVKLINAGCGYDWDIDSMMQCGERGWQLKRMININLGLTRKNDKLPTPLLEPLPDGGAAGYVIDLDALLSDYYEVRKWDMNTGFPTNELLAKLNLSWTIK